MQRSAELEVCNTASDLTVLYHLCQKCYRYSSNKKIKSTVCSTCGAAGHPAQPFGDLQQSVCVKEAYSSYRETEEDEIQCGPEAEDQRSKQTRIKDVLVKVDAVIKR